MLLPILLLASAAAQAEKGLVEYLLSVFVSKMPWLPLHGSHQQPKFIYRSNTGLQIMNKQIFINLPVTDLPRSKAFYEAIGAVNNPAFTDETAACMVISETIYAMLLTHDKWRQFTGKRIVDAHAEAQVLLCLSAGGRVEVSDLVQKATDAGGKADPTPVQDFGFMYGRSFEDPDGHIWEVMWMDPEAVPPHG